MREITYHKEEGQKEMPPGNLPKENSSKREGHKDQAYVKHIMNTF